MEKEKEILEFIQRDNTKMREAGCELAIASMKVIKDYDGIHRLSLAVKDWCEVLANEGNRKLLAPQPENL